MTTSGATWAPNRVSFSGNNRTHMVRVPEGDRFELRLADGAANPYLLQAAVRVYAGIRVYAVLESMLDFEFMLLWSSCWNSSLCSSGVYAGIQA